MLRRMGRNIAGGILILVGLILLPVPVLSGWALIIPGIILLDFPGKREFFHRLAKTPFLSWLLAKSSMLARLWQRLHDGIDSGQPKPPTCIIQLPF